jgi:thymidine phosphorylase
MDKANFIKPILAPRSGFISSIECDQLGYAVIALGGGRKVATDGLDYAVGFADPKKIGDKVTKGEPLIYMHYNDAHKAAEAEKMVLTSYKFSAKPVPKMSNVVTRRIV